MLRIFSSSAVLTAIALLSIGGVPAAAQKRGPAAIRRPPGRPERPAKADRPLETFQKMTPGERQKALEKLPPERRQTIEQRLDRYSKLPPGEKARFEKFNALPPERQQAVRQAIGSLTKLPPERQKAVREELHHMESLSPGDREARTSSEEFRGKFSASEQHLIEQLRDVVPE